MCAYAHEAHPVCVGVADSRVGGLYGVCVYRSTDYKRACWGIDSSVHPGLFRPRSDDTLAAALHHVGTLTQALVSPHGAAARDCVARTRHTSPPSRCVLFTTNKPPKDRGSALHDYDLADGIVDLVLERYRIVPCSQERRCAPVFWGNRL